jgi:hypothetical protein
MKKLILSLIIALPVGVAAEDMPIPFKDAQAAMDAIAAIRAEQAPRRVDPQPLQKILDNVISDGTNVNSVFGPAVALSQDASVVPERFTILALVVPEEDAAAQSDGPVMMHPFLVTRYSGLVVVRTVIQNVIAQVTRKDGGKINLPGEMITEETFRLGLDGSIRAVTVTKATVVKGPDGAFTPIEASKSVTQLSPHAPAIVAAWMEMLPRLVNVRKSVKI